MKILTLKQPWATIIGEGIKQYEIRTWKTNYRGPIMIHAGMGIDREAMKRFDSFNFTYPKSEVICLVELLDCIPITEEFLVYLKHENKKLYGHIEVGGYAWKIKLIKKCSIKDVKGKLGLWEYCEKG